MHAWSDSNLRLNLYPLEYARTRDGDTAVWTPPVPSSEPRTNPRQEWRGIGTHGTLDANHVHRCESHVNRRESHVHRRESRQSRHTARRSTRYGRHTTLHHAHHAPSCPSRTCTRTRSCETHVTRAHGRRSKLNHSTRAQEDTGTE